MNKKKIELYHWGSTSTTTKEAIIQELKEAHVGDSKPITNNDCPRFWFNDKYKLYKSNIRDLNILEKCYAQSRGMEETDSEYLDIYV